MDVTVIYHGWSLDTDDLIQNHHLISQSHIYWIVWDMSISDNLAYNTTYKERERERQRKSRSLFAAAKKKQLKVSPKDKSWGGIRASLPFCVYMCLFCRARSALFQPFHSVQIILHAAQEHKQMPKRWWCGFFLKLEKFFSCFLSLFFLLIIFQNTFRRPLLRFWSRLD